MSKTISRLALLIAVALAPGCTSDVIAPQERHLDRPNDVAFGCLVNAVDDAGVTVAVAAPAEGCSGRIFLPDAGADAAIVPDPPPPDCTGDAGVPDANLTVDAAVDGDAGPFPSTGRAWAFVVEEHRGEVSVVDPNSGVVDIDDLTPGVNGLPVGNLPVAIAMTTDGCYAVTSNKGSCDLSAIDVFKATSSADLDVAVSRVLVSATGGTIAARPEGIATRPALSPDTTPCTSAPAGYAYVAYPSCHMVGVVNLADGNLVSTIRLTDAGPALGGPDATCPIECLDLAAGAAAGVPGDGPEPTTVLVDLDGTRLFVGAWNAPFLTIVSLDPTGLPTSVTQVPLEAPLAGVNEFGIEKLAVTRDTPMGGSPNPDPPLSPECTEIWPSYINEGAGGTRRFVYAITSDGTIRVIDVTPSLTPTECDAQIDPRGVRGVTDLTRLACFPVGDLTNPPRRPDVRGPGIELPHGGLPLDVAFLRAGFFPDNKGTQPIPENLNGTFAVITALGAIDVGPRGVVFYVNVDDNNYQDLENAEFPVIVDLNLALPHQLRDNVADRRHALPQDQDNMGVCFEAGFQSLLVGPTRNEGDPVQLVPGFHNNASAEAGLPNARLAPAIHRVKCDDTHAIYETSPLLRYAVPPSGDPNDFQPLREKVFHDLQRVHIEEWSIIWEGSLSDEETFVRRGGARVVPVGGVLALQDDAGLFCELGAEQLDILEIYGCDTDANCGFGEQCYVHPDAPQGIAGMCLPTDQVNSLAGPCRDFLVSRRHYSITKVYDDHVELTPRLTILPETPIEGCTAGPTGDAECMAIHDRVRQEQAAAEEPPIDVSGVPRFQFACQADESRGGPDRCVMRCDATNLCAAGSVCDGAGRCVLGALPAAECLAPLQQYQVYGGELFIAIGGETGYLHPWIVSTDPMMDGMCVPDPAVSDVEVGRFRRDEPACIEDTVLGLLPNPCSVTLSEPVSSPAGTVVFRDSYAIRFRNRGMRLDIVDVLLDTPEAGDTKRYSPIPSGYGFSWVIGGGFFGRFVAIGAYLPQRIRTAPDGALWILDAGDFNPTSSTRQGQMIRFTAAPDGIDGTAID